jgi:Mn-containing catalase
MLNKGVKGCVAEGLEEQGELYRTITGAGNDSHLTSVLYGGGPPFTNSGGVPWSGAYIDTIGEPTADLRSNIAAEARAKLLYERLMNVTGDSGVSEALGFLMTREIAHQKSFEKALYAIEPNFPPGKTPGLKQFTDKYFNLSKGGDVRGPWNQGDQWEFIDDSDMEKSASGDGGASVKLGKDEEALYKKMAKRTASKTAGDPTTGADIGAGPGAGSTKGDIK